MFEQRRKRFMDSMGPDAVAILIGARLQVRSNDTEFPFRQDSDFWYLTGFGHPDAVAILRTDGGPAYTLFVQPRDRAAETWTGYRPGLEGARDIYGADESVSCDDLLSRLPEMLHGAKRVLHVLGKRRDIDDAIVRELDALRQKSKLGMHPATEIADLREILHEMRLFKEPAELDLMRRAASISTEAHQMAAQLAKPGHHEYELEAALHYTFRRRGASGPAYTSIVGGGSNAAILHYVTNDQPLVGGELVLIDAGAEFESYASDVTRTYPVGGRFEGEARAVYELVLAAQQAALSECRPGNTLTEIHKTTIRVLTEGMVDLSLLRGTVDDLIAEEKYKQFYMHGTSHWLGLDVHDVGTYTKGEAARPLEPGMVFTVEPGIYIAEDDEDVPEGWRGIGVRIEDDVVATPDGHENLNAQIPKTIADVEAWVRAG